mmetsp:Transcript_24077/g.58142  ORF Transcript_24077/g.58142 Transcript_24077/m.58142 type:complete len:529 (-) Transcript_24077:397-1983(-)
MHAITCVYRQVESRTLGVRHKLTTGAKEALTSGSAQPKRKLFFFLSIHENKQTNKRPIILMSTTAPSSSEDALLSAIRSLPKEARNLLAGGLAGMTAKTFVAPIDRIKILYQVTSAHFRLRDVPRVAMSIIEKEGPAALWKGNTATMIRVFPYSGIQFMVFDYCKVHFLGERKRKSSGYNNSGSNAGTTLPKKLTIRNKGSGSDGTQKAKAGLTPRESLESGMVAGTMSVLCTYPLDLARAQLAVLRKKKKAVVDGALDGHPGISKTKPTKKGIGYVLNHSFRNGGFPGLYRGITPTMLGIMPYSGVAFTINEQAKRRISHIAGRDPTTVEKLQCGALSGLFAQTLAYPLEVTRRRMQTIGIVPTSGSDSAAVNFSGVSQLRRSVDELPQEAETMQQQQQRQMPKQQMQQQQAQRLTTAGEIIGQAAIENGNTINTAKIQPQHPQQHYQPPSMMTTMRHLLEEQGVRGFYKGVSMNWLKGPVAFSISFTAFDTIQGWIESEEEKLEKGGRLDAKISISRRLTNNEELD